MDLSRPLSPPRPSRRASAPGRLARRLSTLTCAFAAALLLLGATPYKVVGTSMQPTLEPGDRIWVVEDHYEDHEVAQGELVAIKLRTRKVPLVKRAVAVAGDEARIQGAELHVGDKVYPLPPRGAAILARQLEHYEGRVPPKHLIALGDNPKASMDSAAFGLVSTRQLMGKVLLTPPTPPDAPPPSPK